VGVVGEQDCRDGGFLMAFAMFIEMLGRNDNRFFLDLTDHS
jgi:hypothetical protein